MSLLDIMKQAGIGAVEASQPVAVQTGTVVQQNPLQVQLDQRLILDEAFLVVPEHVQEAKVTIDTGAGQQEVELRRGLEPGDRVLLLRAQGGQRYLILGRVGI